MPLRRFLEMLCSSVSSLNQFLFTPDGSLDLEESARLFTAPKTRTLSLGHSSPQRIHSNCIYVVCEGHAVEKEARGAEKDKSELPLTLLYVKNFRQEAPHSLYHNYTDREERQRGNFFDILEALKLLRSRVDRENISVERESRRMENGSLFEPCLTNTGAQAEAKVHLARAKMDYSWFNKRKMASASRKCFRRVFGLSRVCNEKTIRVISL